MTSSNQSGTDLVWLLDTLQIAAVSDRFLLTLVATPLKRALSLSDTQLSLLQDASFAMPYALAPVAVLGLSSLAGSGATSRSSRRAPRWDAASRCSRSWA